jgi:hypothetical protein
MGKEVSQENKMKGYRRVGGMLFCTRKNAQVVTDLQTSCNKVVVKPISGCVRTACFQLLRQVWNKLL